ncbi:UNVERIFIED_CONTAM: hypothetical protein KB573_03140 [Streptococcus canis]|uniref:Uncharacterized protein n=1 Tax=Streptococcus canis FSL Z3-227 TaxID=482234 RepID=A0AAV3FVB5_STRCB|nr:hypothetical protein [Streptococcus canis]EIQ82863.1 hypothetical protein SCAZ3_10890 [Streptococcus canis FSL Z3-227]MDV5988390.1 hypothetical protein [Streptococcus canis]MDV5992865.1 hypothetical protein [Streptococcus canis]MDV6000521.1 hypothetical protein [Streptococcus canis]MDV6022020.1 hypothetical protein [Streptococcus canis]
MKKKLFFVSALALLTTGIALNTESTVSASSTRLSSLNVRNILDEYDRQLNWDISTYKSTYRYWMMQVRQKNMTADDMRRELDKALYGEDSESDYY